MACNTTLWRDFLKKYYIEVKKFDWIQGIVGFILLALIGFFIVLFVEAVTEAAILVISTMSGFQRATGILSFYSILWIGLSIMLVLGEKSHWKTKRIYIHKEDLKK